MRLHSGISDAGSDNAWKVWRTSQKPEADPYRYSRARLHDSLALVLGALTTIHMDFKFPVTGLHIQVTTAKRGADNFRIADNSPKTSFLRFPEPL
jgi:hypothetical protein